MKSFSFRKFALATGVLLVSMTLVGCEENKGPVEKAGAGIDQAGKDIKNGLDPRGPAEKVGDKVDHAVGNK